MISPTDLEALNVILDTPTGRAPGIHPSHAEAIRAFVQNTEGLTRTDLGDLLMHLHYERRRFTACTDPESVEKLEWVMRLIGFFENAYAHAKQVERSTNAVLNPRAAPAN